MQASTRCGAWVLAISQEVDISKVWQRWITRLGLVTGFSFGIAAVCGLAISDESRGLGRRCLSFSLFRGLGRGLGSGRGRGRSGYRGQGCSLHLAFLNWVGYQSQSVFRGEVLGHNSIRVLCRKEGEWEGLGRQEGEVNEVAGGNEGLAGLDCPIPVRLLDLCLEWEESGSNSGELEGESAVFFIGVKTAMEDSDVTLANCNSIG